ncbi:MAG: hypothetical protein IPK66_07315 [Rhodospirillales bacterium]|nr:hypothetical protein [Rhodospirillales bacterium]
MLAMAVLAASPAYAHKLKVFATAVGPRIDGSAYFVGGGPARGAKIVVATPGGETLALLQTDDDGKFAITATRRVDHVIIVDCGDGHVARFVIAAEDLPASLPESSQAGAQAAVNPNVSRPSVEEAMQPAGKAGPEALPDAVAAAVAAQIRPLREQLNAFEDEVQLRDILGGLGYILGLAGLAAWLRARQRERARR